MKKEINWEKILAELTKKIPSQEFMAWLEPTKLISCTEQEIRVAAPTSFHCDWINDHLKDKVLGTLRELYGIKPELILGVATEISSENSDVPLPLESEKSFPVDLTQNFSTPSSEASAPLQSQLSMPLETMEKPPSLSFGSSERSKKSTFFEIGTTHHEIKTVAEPILAHHTFETFLVGTSNQFAHAACKAVAEFPATQYNPLFIYSNAGLGKTHLLHAIGNSFLKTRPKTKICYLSAETFVNELIESVRNFKMQQFRQKYRDSFDVLLMDDFQFLAGKDRTQEEFFHTFNALHRSRRQIVVTSDKPPSEIPGLEERIRTRFECGLIADIQPPEIETRIAILKAKAERDDIFLPDDVALLIASNVKSNIRELEGVLIHLEAQASLNGVEISLELAKKELSSRVKDPVSSVSSDLVLSVVSQHFNLKIADLKSKDRSRKFSLPRQISMYFLRKYTGKSLPEIGLCLGGKDHSTVLHGINMITTAIETDPIIQKHIQEVQNLL